MATVAHTIADNHSTSLVSFGSNGEDAAQLEQTFIYEVCCIMDATMERGVLDIYENR